MTWLLGSSRGIVTMRGNGALFLSQRVQLLTVERAVRSTLRSSNFDS